jgi:hypothetical protein
MTEEIIHVLGQKWHPHCFTCTSSGKPITKNAEGSYLFFPHDLMPYCEEEYARLFGETCMRCSKTIVNDKIEWLGDYWHKDCLTCENCNRKCAELSDGKYAQGPEDGFPYCLPCYGRKFGDSCPACKFPVNPGLCPVEALGRMWHKEHFCCVKCHVGLFEEGSGAKEFFPYHDSTQNREFPFCRDCYLTWLCQRCSGCGEPIKPDDDALTLQDGGGGNAVYHKECHRCFIYESTFDEKDTIYMNDGYP